MAEYRESQDCFAELRRLSFTYADRLWPVAT